MTFTELQESESDVGLLFLLTTNNFVNLFDFGRRSVTVPSSSSLSVTSDLEHELGSSRLELDCDILLSTSLNTISSLCATPATS